jgi:cytoplasmic iron level regulating protein YaaA (DUF328/UPF0246 family)
VFGPVLAPARAELVAALLAAAADGSLAAGIGGTPAHQQAATARALAVLTSPTMRAAERYTGVLYAFQRLAQLPPGARGRALGAVVVSGLAGLVTLADPLPDYTVPIGLALPGTGRLATWWRPHISGLLDERVAGAVVWDLLPAAHAAAWADGGSHAARYRVRVLREEPDGRRITVSHDNKSTKGLLARRLAERVVRRPAELADWAAAQGLGLEIRSDGVDLIRLSG